MKTSLGQSSSTAAAAAFSLPPSAVFKLQGKLYTNVANVMELNSTNWHHSSTFQSYGYYPLLFPWPCPLCFVSFHIAAFDKHIL